MKNKEMRDKIIYLKDQIHDLTEYLQSDICRGCGEAAIQIDKYVKELSELISLYDSNN